MAAGVVNQPALLSESLALAIIYSIYHVLFIYIYNLATFRHASWSCSFHDDDLDQL